MNVLKNDQSQRTCLAFTGIFNNIISLLALNPKPQIGIVGVCTHIGGDNVTFPCYFSTFTRR